MRRICPLILCASVLAAALSLAGCGAATRNPDTAGATSGVTVYGTVDAGLGRVRQ